MGRVVIGMDPHKRAATIEVVDEQEQILAQGRFGTDTDGYQAMLRQRSAVPEPDVGGGGLRRGSVGMSPSAWSPTAKPFWTAVDGRARRAWSVRCCRRCGEPLLHDVDR
jgi:hypothetical protein